MTPEAFEAAALALPGAEMSVKWGADRVFTVGGKMFAVLGMNATVQHGQPPPCSFKVDDVAYEMLVAQPGIRPAPYLARAKWVQLDTLQALPDAEIKARLKRAHELVASKLPKKDRPAG